MPFLIAICASILNASFKLYPSIRRRESLTLPVDAVLPKYVLKIPPKTSAPPWKAAPKIASSFTIFPTSSSFCSCIPLASSFDSSKALPAPDPAPTNKALPTLESKAPLNHFTPLRYGLTAVIAPNTGPAYPAKSAKSPPVNALFSSITIFFLDAFKPKAVWAAGVKARLPFESLTYPFEPIPGNLFNTFSFSDTYSPSFLVKSSATANCALKALFCIPVS